MGSAFRTRRTKMPSGVPRMALKGMAASWMLFRRGKSRG